MELGISRAIKGIKERITGKDGQLRNNLMGKRVEFSGRTVIGPDPYLKFGEMGLPPQVAKELTVPECVQIYNMEVMTHLVNEGKANYLIRSNKKINLQYASIKRGTTLLYGDIVIRDGIQLVMDNKKVFYLKPGDLFQRPGLLHHGDKIIREGKRLTVTDSNQNLHMGDQVERQGKIISIVNPPQKKTIQLKIGDIIHRHLRNGDILLINRQPTLHIGSMMAKRVRILPGKTFRLNLATTKSFNADFNIGIKQEA